MKHDHHRSRTHAAMQRHTGRRTNMVAPNIDIALTYGPLDAACVNGRMGLVALFGEFGKLDGFYLGS